MTKNLLGAVIFLALSAVYLWQLFEIPMLPGDEFEPFTARTMPYSLVLMSFVVAGLMLALEIKKILAARAASEAITDTLDLSGLVWAKTIAMIALMIFYGFILEPAGFIIATSVFLLIGYWVLGERRPLMLFGASVPVVVVFWFLLTKLLGIYLAPGVWFN